MSERCHGFSLSPKWQLLLIAVAWTALNCAKPVHIDDASYLKFAREFAYHPLDPYAFQLNWDQWPEPAIWFTSPAVLPYWLAPAAKFFYNTPWIIKLWMFPFAWLFAWSFYQLCRRFVRSHEMLLCWMTVFSAGFLPGLNLFLDIPSIAFFLAALELTFRAMDRNSIRLAIASGVLAALAVETKYTTLIAPGVLLVAGLMLRRVRIGVIAAACALLLIVAWESLLAMKYGQSQFLAQLTIDDPRRRLSTLDTILHLPPYLAAPWPFLILLGLAALRVRGIALALISVLFAVAILATQTWLFNVLSAGLVAITIVVIARSMTREPAERRFTYFLLAWLAIEIAGALVISPFPAVRRLFGIALVLTLLIGRAAVVLAPQLRVRSISWGIACAACIGVALIFFASDFEEALARQKSMEVCNAVIRKADPAPRIWYTGHWGAEYYAERCGMRPLVPDQTILHAGDWLVVADGVHTQGVVLTPQMLTLIDRPLTKFHLRWSTARSYYGGIVPITWHRKISNEMPVTGLAPLILRVTRDGILPSAISPGDLVDMAMHRGAMSPDGLVRALINVIVNGAPEDVQPARHALIHIGPRAMIIALRNADPRIRLFAAEELGRLDHLDRDARNALETATQDPEPAVRTAASRALSSRAM